MEEVTNADWKEQPISGGAIRTIKNLTNKLKIDTYKLLNSCGYDKNGNMPKASQADTIVKLIYDGSKVRYTGLEDETLMNSSGAVIIMLLNKMQQGTLPVDETLKRVDE